MSSQQRGSIRTVVIGVAAAILVGLLLGRLISDRNDKVDAKPSRAPSICADEPPSFIKAKFLREEPYPMTIDPKSSYQARIVTSCGTMFVDLLAKRSPIAVNNFVNLAKDAWFSGTYFTDMTKNPDTVLAGDPSGDGTGQPGYTIKDDAPNGLDYEEGSLVMAGTGEPDSAGSQFFVITGSAALEDLPTGLTVFGELVGDTSLQVAKKINSVPPPTDPAGEKVWIQGVRIDERPGA